MTLFKVLADTTSKDVSAEPYLLMAAATIHAVGDNGKIFYGKHHKVHLRVLREMSSCCSDYSKIMLSPEEIQLAIIKYMLNRKGIDKVESVEFDVRIKDGERAQSSYPILVGARIEVKLE
jgi:hypothetical protein